MIHLGLIGYPLVHSLSPIIHTAALRNCGLEGDYSLFPLFPGDGIGLRTLLARITAGELHGLNVTIPYKQNVIPLLDELTPRAEAIGAVNTILLRGGKLVGENTDAPGFLSDLRRFMGMDEPPAGRRALVLGAGGSARAVAYALTNAGWNVTVSARRIEQAQAFAVRFNTAVVPMDSGAIERLHAHLVVNTTPVGMTPDDDRSPLPDSIILSHDTLIYDLVYDPNPTKLVKEAIARGLKAVTGFGMLIDQAALAFEIWTGCRPERSALLSSIHQ